MRQLRQKLPDERVLVGLRRRAFHVPAAARHELDLPPAVDHDDPLGLITGREILEPGVVRRLRVYRSEAMRVLTLVNLVLWVVLFAGWVPYTLMVGPMDPAAIEVRWILAATACMQLALFGLRIARHRPVLG